LPVRVNPLLPRLVRARLLRDGVHGPDPERLDADLVAARVLDGVDLDLGGPDLEERALGHLLAAVVVLEDSHARRRRPVEALVARDRLRPARYVRRPAERDRVLADEPAR